MPVKEDKCIETELNMVDKYVGNDDEIINENKNIETNKSIPEVLEENPSFSDVVSCNFSKTEEFDMLNNKTSIISEKSESIQSTPCLSLTTEVVDINASTPNDCINKKNDPHTIEFNDLNCSTPAKSIEVTKNNVKPAIPFSPINIHNQIS